MTDISGIDRKELNYPYKFLLAYVETMTMMTPYGVMGLLKLHPSSQLHSLLSLPFPVFPQARCLYWTTEERWTWTLETMRDFWTSLSTETTTSPPERSTETSLKRRDEETTWERPYKVCVCVINACMHRYRKHRKSLESYFPGVLHRNYCQEFPVTGADSYTHVPLYWFSYTSRILCVVFETLPSRVFKPLQTHSRVKGSLKDISCV